MPKRLAVKRLTNSDLSFFTWHFRSNPAVRQKAINLNADIFVNEIYPSLPETEAARSGRIPLDLFIYGPGLSGELNVQRKVVKTPSYKNWRLNGEMVDDPDRPDRFIFLSEGDFVVFEFNGDIFPISAKAIFVAKAMSEDASLHSAFERIIGARRMIALKTEELEELIQETSPPTNHPVYELILDEALEDVVLGGSRGAERLLRRRSGAKLSKEQLLQARAKVDEIGRKGEECVNLFLGRLEDEGSIDGFDWISDENAIAPYDFRIRLTDSTNPSIVLVDAKSTLREFDRTIHISLSELREMAGAGVRYDLYRIYDIGETTAQLRIARDMRSFAENVLRVLDNLPIGILADGISVTPSLLPFEEAITIELSEESEQE